MTIRWFTTKFRKIRQLKSIAERRNISMREVSDATGINWRTIQRYETEDQGNPDPAIVEKLAQYYGKSLDDFVNIDDDEGEVIEAPKLMAGPS